MCLLHRRSPYECQSGFQIAELYVTAVPRSAQHSRPGPCDLRQAGGSLLRFIAYCFHYDCGMLIV